MDALIEAFRFAAHTTLQWVVANHAALLQAVSSVSENTEPL